MNIRDEQCERSINNEKRIEELLSLMEMKRETLKYYETQEKRYRDEYFDMIVNTRESNKTCKYYTNLAKQMLLCSSRVIALDEDIKQILSETAKLKADESVSLPEQQMPASPELHGAIVSRDCNSKTFGFNSLVSLVKYIKEYFGFSETITLNSLSSLRNFSPYQPVESSTPLNSSSHKNFELRERDKAGMAVLKQWKDQFQRDKAKNTPRTPIMCISGSRGFGVSRMLEMLTLVPQSAGYRNPSKNILSPLTDSQLKYILIDTISDRENFATRLRLATNILVTFADGMPRKFDEILLPSDRKSVV